MIIKEKYTITAKLNNLSGTIIFFANKKFEVKNISNLLNSFQVNLLKKNLKNNTKKKEIFSFDISHNQKIVIYSIMNNKDSYEKNGAKLYEFLKKENLNKIYIYGDTIENSNNIKCLHELIHGMKLKSYTFDKYLTKKNSEALHINIISKKKIDLKLIKNLSAIEKGVNFTKDLVSEPGNVLHPDEYARRLTQLKKLGLKVTVYNTSKLKKMKAFVYENGKHNNSLRLAHRLVSMSYKNKKAEYSSKNITYIDNPENAKKINQILKKMRIIVKLNNNY